MGAGVSSGENNDELVDNLKDADYIRSDIVERVFRAVDRGHYYLRQYDMVNAYADMAWKHGNFHISAPCIYSEVMEGLNLRAGLSFLNLGSGTGYLNTLVGLTLGVNGINHGIELHADIVKYAHEKLEEFKLFSGAMDQFDFCEPKFVQGNCLCLPNNVQRYDRVYCGAGCSEAYLTRIQDLVKIDGILIIPLEDKLLQYRRTSATDWKTECLLPVSFATLTYPSDTNNETAQLPTVQPLSLQELSRFCIRTILRNIVDKTHPQCKRYHRNHDAKPKKKEAEWQSEVFYNYYQDPDEREQEAAILRRFQAECDAAMRSVGLDTSSNDEEIGSASNETAAVNFMNDPTLARSAYLFKLLEDSALLRNADNCNGDANDDDDDNEDNNDDEFNDSGSCSTKTNRSNKVSNANHCKRLKVVNDSSSSDNDEDIVSQKVFRNRNIRVYTTPYTPYMQQRIKKLPLPTILKRYVNFNRQFLRG